MITQRKPTKKSLFTESYIKNFIFIAKKTTDELARNMFYYESLSCVFIFETNC